MCRTSLLSSISPLITITAFAGEKSELRKLTSWILSTFRIPLKSGILSSLTTIYSEKSALTAFSLNPEKSIISVSPGLISFIVNLPSISVNVSKGAPFLLVVLTPANDSRTPSSVITTPLTTFWVTSVSATELLIIIECFSISLKLKSMKTADPRHKVRAILVPLMSLPEPDFSIIASLSLV